MDLNELERLANAATPGPWSWTNNEGWAYPQTHVDSEGRANIARFVNGAPQFECTVGEARQEWRNAAFIAAANPFVVLELVRRLRDAEKDATHWKANHATEVRRARVLKERPDMPLERVDAYKQIGELLARVAEAEADAARYRYIRTHRIGVKWCELYAGGPELDTAIDAMIQPARGGD